MEYPKIVIDRPSDVSAEIIAQAVGARQCDRVYPGLFDRKWYLWTPDCECAGRHTLGIAAVIEFDTPISL